MSQTVVDTLKQTFAAADALTADDLAKIYSQDIVFVDPLGRIEAVSYTHLTLPTNREV